MCENDECAMHDNEPTEEAFFAYFDSCKKIIDEHGWMIQGVMGDADNEAFTYTVGLASRNLPELIVFSLSSGYAQTVLNDLAERLTAGSLVLHNGLILKDVFGDDYKAMFIEVSDSSEHLTMANRLYGLEEPLAAFQVVFPDAEHRWPWEQDSKVAEMPVLGAIDV